MDSPFGPKCMYDMSVMTFPWRRGQKEKRGERFAICVLSIRY